MVSEKEQSQDESALPEEVESTDALREEDHEEQDEATTDTVGEVVLSENAAEADEGEEINEIVGATTRTVHEDITRFLDTFERSAKRWEMVVYPAMFAFIILAGYGFFLIYSLTDNMNTIAESFDPQMALHMDGVATNMQDMTENIALMTDQVHSMSTEIKAISGQMVYLSSMKPMTQAMSNMEQSIQRMSGNFEMMRRDMSVLNHNISKPMSFMNNFIPW
jgi:hypothetical protein